MKRWYFSLLLGAGYLLIFHLWRIVGRTGIILTGVLATFILLLLFVIAAFCNYFRNRWDALLHVAVILDIFLEAILIPSHHDRGFYLCALAFAIVIVGYRLYLGPKKSAIQRY